MSADYLFHPWVEKPDMVSHALNAAGERIMYNDVGGGLTKVADEQFDATVQIMYSMWCSALRIRQGSEKRIAQECVQPCGRQDP